MKVAISHKLQTGPYGGGNAFVKNLVQALQSNGHSVVFDLKDKDIDIILLTDPRARSPNINFAAGVILRYLTFCNPNAIVVHRINECDERKNTRGMNFRLRIANYCADHTVFVGSWLKNLNVYDRRNNSNSVILNGGDTSIFNASGYQKWNGAEPLKIVTHHWGGNWMKGFDVYQRLDQMQAEPEWQGKIDFTYIGNVPSDFRFKNATLIKPLSGAPLADEIRKNHIYITGSINEPGGNHQIEGGLCGLPLLYRNSGCMPEYCAGYGVMFDGVADVKSALQNIMQNYNDYADRMKIFPYTAERTSTGYLALFDNLISRKEQIIAQRRFKKSLGKWWLNQIPY